MSKAASMLRFGAAQTRSKKAKANAGMAGVTAGMAVRDSAKAAAHAAAGLALTVRDEAVDRAAELTDATRRTGEQAMLRVGDWVMTAPVAERLGIKARSRRVSALGALIGVAAGMTAGVLLGRRMRQDHVQASWDEPESLAPPLGQGQIDIRDADGGPNADMQAPSTTVTA